MCGGEANSPRLTQAEYSYIISVDLVCSQHVLNFHFSTVLNLHGIASTTETAEDQDILWNPLDYSTDLFTAFMYDQEAGRGA